MRSKVESQFFKNRKTSDLTTRRFEIPNLIAMSLMKAKHFSLMSTAVTCLAPREINSTLIPPIPANKSRTVSASKSIL